MRPCVQTLFWLWMLSVVAVPGAAAAQSGAGSGDGGEAESARGSGTSETAAAGPSGASRAGGRPTFRGGTQIPFRATLIPLVHLPPSPAGDAVPSYAFNFAGRNYALRGLETGLLFNSERAYADGVQFAFGGNWVSGPVRGLQTSGLLNVAEGGTRGVGVTLGANIAGGLRGVHAAMVGNWVHGDAHGLELGGINWTTGRVAGVQVGGVNVAGDVAGLQGGLLNVGGEVDGLQLGLLNVAERSEVSLDLVNINWGRPAYGSFWLGETGLASVGLQHGSEHLYHLLRVGYQPIGVQRLFVPGLGFGGHFPVEYLGVFPGYLELDALYNLAFPTGNTDVAAGHWMQIRLTLGLEIVGRLAMYGGASANAIASDAAGPVLAPPEALPSVQPASWFGFWPGFFAGVRF